MQKRIRSTIKAFNNLPVFYPERWPHRETLARITALLVFFGYLLMKASYFDPPPYAKGFGEVAFPFLVAGLPMVMVLAIVNFSETFPLQSGFYVVYYATALGLILVGALINLIGLLTMPRVFAIMPEARILVTRGIFRYVRHPLYAGHFILFFGSLGP